MTKGWIALLVLAAFTTGVAVGLFASPSHLTIAQYARAADAAFDQMNREVAWQRTRDAEARESALAALRATDADQLAHLQKMLTTTTMVCDERITGLEAILNRHHLVQAATR